MHDVEYTSFWNLKGGILLFLFWKEILLMNEVIEKEVVNIENMIYKIDGVEVMLDSDLVNLYQVETKRINDAVYRNKVKISKRISWITSNE